jgi:hypothetical protein
MGDPPGGITRASGKRRIVWEDSNARDAYANAVDVMSTREEVSLLLGTTQVGRRDDNAEIVALTNRIAMSPLAAKRFAVQLSNAVREYESKYGSLETKTPSVMPALISEPCRTPIDHEAGEKAGLLFRLVEGLNVEVGFEQSFKIVDANLLDNRFLLGVSKEAIGSRADDDLTSVCSLMGMPEKLLDIFRHYLPQANYVHFGFEQTKQSAVYKVYLEFWGALKEEIRESDQRPGPALLHLGLKWDVFNPTGQVLTRYTWHPWLSPQEIMQAVTGVLAPHTEATPKQAADELISMAVARAPYRDILYLDVTEEGNPRRSFDVNVYRANLRIEEVYPLLSVLCRRHSIPFDTFHSLYDRIKTKRLGHLAAGVDRNGKDFFTVYYGVEGIVDERTKERRNKEGLEIRTKYSAPVRRQHISRIEETDDKAGRLFRLVKGLGVRGAFERSFKFLNRALLNDRFLIGFKRATTSTEQDNAIVDVCRVSEMPQDYLEIFRAELNESHIVLFGFEKNEKNRLYKAYLEFSGRLAEAVAQNPRPKSVITHSGFKWDVSDNSRRMLARYTAYPFFRAEEMATRIMSSFYGNHKEAPFPIVDDILDLVGSRTRPGEILYCETSEAGNPRSSFDINAYKADLKMAEIYPMLLKTARHYSIDLNRFEELYEGVKDMKFGHLSGGTDREGRDFLTVYFGQKGTGRESIALTQQPQLP